jgi:YggT family protein
MLERILLTLVHLFQYALFIRVILDYVRIFARNWNPPVFLIGFFELIYTITEPPMAFVRRFIPPLRLGSVALDLSFFVLLIAVNVVEGLIIVLL